VQARDETLKNEIARLEAEKIKEMDEAVATRTVC
jgi:uncharacterized small protein (DUF1192 family)